MFLQLIEVTCIPYLKSCFHPIKFYIFDFKVYSYRCNKRSWERVARIS